MKNYFQRSEEHPYHISVGAVLINEKEEVCTHYFKNFFHPAVGQLNDFYNLMRETVEPNETLEQALARGLMEEFGATGNLKSFLGSIVAKTPQEDYIFEKTTLYFLYELVEIDPSKCSKADKEIGSEIRWVPIKELIPIMKDQKVRLKREDFDESLILERIIN